MMKAMKKLLALFAVCAMAIPTIACGGKGGDDSSFEESSSTQSSSVVESSPEEVSSEEESSSVEESSSEEVSSEEEVSSVEEISSEEVSSEEESSSVEESSSEEISSEEESSSVEESSSEEVSSEEESSNDIALLHSLTHTEAVEAVRYTEGNIEYWYCDDCETYFADEEATVEISQAETVIPAPFSVVDFVVEVPEDRDPVILQLNDSQSSNPLPYYNEYHAYRYMRQIIEETQPDLIIVGGDNIYGKFDTDGGVWTSFISFMDSFQIPWAPVMGNHDVECPMGADWQCEQLENAKYCLFEQRTLTGNGNYTVAIAQGNDLQRVFFMMDTNANTGASEASLANGHTSKATGFGADQIAWYKEVGANVKAVFPEIKISFTFHIGMKIFDVARTEKYGDTLPLNIDTLPNKDEGDFGYAGYGGGGWDNDFTVWNSLKALGVDSIFVGHSHGISSSIVYQGVRLQFGQKSTTCDSYNAVKPDGSIVDNWFTAYHGAYAPLVGGTVMPMSKEDGSFVNPYIQMFDFDKYEDSIVTEISKKDETYFAEKNWADGEYLYLFKNKDMAVYYANEEKPVVFAYNGSSTPTQFNGDVLAKAVELGFTKVALSINSSDSLWFFIANSTSNVKATSSGTKSWQVTVDIADLLDESTGEYNLFIKIAGWWGGLTAYIDCFQFLKDSDTPDFPADSSSSAQESSEEDSSEPESSAPESSAPETPDENQDLIDSGLASADTNWASADYLSLWTAQNNSFTASADGLAMKAVDADEDGNTDKGVATLNANVLKAAVEQDYTHITIVTYALGGYNFWTSIFNGGDKALATAGGKSFPKDAPWAATVALADLYNSETGKYELNMATTGWWGGCQWVIQSVTFSNATETLIANGIKDANTNWASTDYKDLWTAKNNSFTPSADGLAMKAVDADKDGSTDVGAANLNANVLKAAVEQGYTHITIVTYALGGYNFWTYVKDASGSTLATAGGKSFPKDAPWTATVALADLYNSETGKYELNMTTTGWWGGCQWVIQSVTFSTVNE